MCYDPRMANKQTIRVEHKGVAMDYHYAVENGEMQTEKITLAGSEIDLCPILSADMDDTISRMAEDATHAGKEDWQDHGSFDREAADAEADRYFSNHH